MDAGGGGRPRLPCARWRRRGSPRAKAKEWAEADRLRGELQAAGWEMEDRADGYELKPRG